MLMKLHSYNSYNIELHHKLIRLNFLLSVKDHEIDEIKNLEMELKGNGKMFPLNQTFSNFFVLGVLI
jgi:hypothetical protein